MGELQVARVDDLESEEVFRIPGLTGLFKPFAFLREPHQFAVAVGEGLLEKWDHVANVRLATFDGPPGQHISASPMVPLLASQEPESGRIALYGWKREKYLAALTRLADPVFAFAWSPDGSELVLALGYGQIQIWNIATLCRRLARIGLDWE